MKGSTLPMLAAGHFHVPNIVIKMPALVTMRPRVFVATIKNMERPDPYYIALDLMRPGNRDKVRVCVSCIALMYCMEHSKLPTSTLLVYRPV
jgi:hypothetical protein